MLVIVDDAISPKIADKFFHADEFGSTHNYSCIYSYCRYHTIIGVYCKTFIFTSKGYLIMTSLFNSLGTHTNCSSCSSAARCCRAVAMYLQSSSTVAAQLQCSCSCKQCLSCLRCYIVFTVFRLRDGIYNVLSISSLGNQYIQANKPWDLLKGSDEDR